MNIVASVDDKRHKVTICVLTYNRGPLLRELLKQICALRYQPLQIIVVDNHSEDDTPNIMAGEFANVEYFRLPQNIGAAARNVGLKNATGEFIITLDDDVFGIDEKAIREIVDIFETKKKIGVINFRITDFYTGDICNWVHHCNHETCAANSFLTYEITEGAVAFRKAILEISGYYTDYFFISHEGPDLAFRIMDAGFLLVYIPSVSVIHRHSALGRKNWLNYYYDTRNSVWIAVRNFPLCYSIAYLFRSLVPMAVYATRDGYLKYWVKAVMDAIRHIDRIKKDRSVIKKDTMKMIREIDRQRPSLRYYLKNRILKKNVRL